MESTALISILSGIKSLESTFSSVLMEAVLKLIKLTDSNVFILVESESMGRCFGGNKLLCDAFRLDGLKARRGDVEMDADLHASSLSSATVVTAGAEDDASFRPSRRDESSILIPSCSSAKSENRRSSFPPNGSKVERSSPDFEWDEWRNAGDSGRKRKGEERETSTSSRKRIRSDSREREEDEEEEFAVTDEDAEEVIQIESDDDVVAAANYSGDSDGFLAFLEETGTPAAKLVAHNIRHDVHVKNKLVLIKKVADFERFKDKNSIERKVLTSFFYSLGSLFVSHQEYATNKLKRITLFVEIWNWFSFLHSPSLCDRVGYVQQGGPLMNVCKEAFVRAFRNRERNKSLSSTCN